VAPSSIRVGILAAVAIPGRLNLGVLGESIELVVRWRLRRQHAVAAGPLVGGVAVEALRPMIRAAVDVPSREEALEWAAKVAVACRCPRKYGSPCPTQTSDRRPTAARPLPRVFQRRRRATQGIRNVPLQALATVGVAAGHGRRRCYRSMAIRMGRRRPPRFGVRPVDAYVHACWAGRRRGGAGGLDLNAGGRLAQ
jgi:hypothetical protein